MSLLVSVGNWKVWHWGGLQWNNIICSLMKLGSTNSKVWGGGGGDIQTPEWFKKYVFFPLYKENKLKKTHTQASAVIMSNIISYKNSLTRQDRKKMMMEGDLWYTLFIWCLIWKQQLTWRYCLLELCCAVWYIVLVSENTLLPWVGGSRLSNMLVTIYQTTWCHIPEDSNHHHHCLENLKFQTVYFCWTFLVATLVMHIYHRFLTHTE
jgi:hypothetical protein